MARFVLAALAWVVCVGGVSFYMHARDSYQAPRSVQAVAPEAAAARYDLELTLTFDARPDPFALSDDEAAPVSLRLNGEALDSALDGVGPGEPWRLEGMQGVVQGVNELLVTANPPVGDARSNGVRARVTAHGQDVADETFWSRGGERIIGALRFTVGGQDGDGHDH